MSHNLQNPYFNNDFDEYIDDLYEIEGVRKIKELSRQLRTFFNYMAEVIRYRFRSNLSSPENGITTKFFTQKQRIESLSYEFIVMLKRIKKNGETLEEGIRSLYLENKKSWINELSVIIEEVSYLIHYFSEENIHKNLKFLKYIILLAQNICLVKKCLNVQFSAFYEELELNYINLERDVASLVEKTPDVKNRKMKKQLGERLTL